LCDNGFNGCMASITIAEIEPMRWRTKRRGAAREPVRVKICQMNERAALFQLRGNGKANALRRAGHKNNTT
jgi:hypothetical protein